MSRFEKIVLTCFLAFVAVVAYGLWTDCPGSAGYTYCSPSERHWLRYGR